MAMLLTTSGTSSFSVALPDEQATQRLAIDIANSLEPGDFVTLSGDLGAGKTAFARALIRYLAGDPAIEVPSPTFTLMQSYDLPQFQLIHADFYRLNDPGELAELGIDEWREDGVLLAEWPEQSGGFASEPGCLGITLEIVGNGRAAIVLPGRDWLERGAWS